jgi:hypothetical protein
VAIWPPRHFVRRPASPERKELNVKRQEPTVRSHESVDHVHPTDAGLMDPKGEQIPATGVMGDETLVRLTSEGEAPYPGAPPHSDHRSGEARPGPTRWGDQEATDPGTGGEA